MEGGVSSGSAEGATWAMRKARSSEDRMMSTSSSVGTDSDKGCERSNAKHRNFSGGVAFLTFRSTVNGGSVCLQCSNLVYHIPISVRHR